MRHLLAYDCCVHCMSRPIDRTARSITMATIHYFLCFIHFYEAQNRCKRFELCPIFVHVV